MARREGRDPWDVIYDLMLQSDGREFLLYPIMNFGGAGRRGYDGLAEMLRDPLTIQGLGDGGAHSAIVCDASMTTYLLSYWVRDRDRDRLRLEEAVRRLTHDAASFYGIRDRGVLAPGMRADINVFDLDRLALAYPERVADLPAAGTRLIQRSSGYIETIVAGEAIVVDGELTNARPGRLIRSA
jgi:N-acyl-D-aspartate/D-glutamate deacylase